MSALPIYIESITPRGILSFGPDTPPLKLGPLNVLIGPNGSGKSNLIDVLRLFKALPFDLQEAVQDGGGIQDLIWRGCNVPTKPSVELTLNFLGSVFHRIVFRDNGSTDFPLLLLDSEIISRNNCTVYESSIFSRALNIASTHINSITEDPELISLPFGTTHKLDQSGLAQFHSPD